MASEDVREVLQLKLQLKESSGSTLLKILEKLQDLDITLDILAETGIGKVVNSFRKHDDAGEVAKTLINRWKKLVPKDPPRMQNVARFCPAEISRDVPEKDVAWMAAYIQNLEKPPTTPLKEQSKSEFQKTGKEEKSLATESTSSSKRELKNKNTAFDGKLSKKTDEKNRGQPAVDKVKLDAVIEKKQDVKKDADIQDLSQAANRSLQSKDKSTSNSQAEPKTNEPKIDKTKVSDITNKHRITSEKRKKNSLEDDDLIEKERIKKRKVFKEGHHKEKKARPKETNLEEDPGSDGCETSSMSFEACLNYELETPKRMKKSSDKKHRKRLKAVLNKNIKVSSGMSSQSVTNISAAMASKQSVLELLNVPLPPISTECDDLSQFQYFAKKTVEEKPTGVCEDAPVFTGQRLNKKMQVYSGSKAVYLPTMMSLYQQCIRTLQNNIDSLYEIGGVPFEIVEPVLDRCTPEQLLRIEECNPVYMGVTDHLWERHCHRDFRNARLEEYESWREMYLRLFEERERKLQQLTKSIVRAHSGKPKGRQVKMAFIHSAAKPPRNVRLQQELHGTASAGLPHPTDKPSGKSHESRGRPSFSEPTKPSLTGSGPSQCQDPRKSRRVAPMMAKSLKAFKKQLGRR